MLGLGLRTACRGRVRLLWQQPQLRLDGGVLLSLRLSPAASVAPQPRPTLCSAPPTEDILWDYYQQNKPTKAPIEIRLPEIYERDAQLADLARDAETAFKAYKRRTD